MFIDVTKIELIAGKGGDGAVAFRREKYEPSGGPAGGDGGNGGSIYFVADEDISSLMDFKYKTKYRAENGDNGRNKKQYGKKGKDLYLKVPVGTLIKDFETDTVIHDMKYHNEVFLICKGGRGGNGNAKYTTSTRQAPRFAQPGTLGEERIIKLELKLIADVGLIGLPNVGKSTLLSVISNAKPKIANYHFTTLDPNLGIVKVDENFSFTVADIPGIIEGAHEGIGLGLEFLKHVERTKVLAHVLDISGSEERDPLADYELIEEEIRKYNIKNMNKKRIVLCNKIDIGGQENYDRFVKKYKNEVDAIIPISAATTKNVNQFIYECKNLLGSLKDEYDTFDEGYTYYEETKKEDYFISKDGDTYEVTGPLIDNLIYRTNFEAYESVNHLQKILKDKKIIEQLENMGIKDGNTVILGNVEFDYFE